MDDSTYTAAKLQSEARIKWTNRSGTAKKDGSFYSMKIQEEGIEEPTTQRGEREMDEYGDRLARETSMYRTLGDEHPFAERLASDIQRVQQEDKMENTFKHEIKVVKLDNHYHVSVGCRETIVHDKKEALRWLGKLWDEHIKEE